MSTVLISAYFIIGAFLAWRHGAKCYDRGITDAVLMHRSGRLKYNTYLDENGVKLINIVIDSIE